MTAQTELDAATEAFSESIFEVPAYIAGTPYGVLYNSIIDRLRIEAAGLPMNTVQVMMIDRIATTFVFLRQAEAAPGSIPAVKQSELNKSLIAMFKDFNSMLVISGDKYRENLIQKVGKAVLSGLKLIRDSEDRAAVTKSVQDELRAIGF